MNLTQWTHGRLLAALSFNNHYPSPSSPSLSISCVSRVSVLPCLLILAFLSCPRSPCFSTHSLHLMYHISDIRTWLSVAFIASEASFHLFFAAWLSHPHSVSSSSARPPPLFISLWLHPLVQSTAKKILQNSGCCCQRDSRPRKSDLFIHALFPAIQIKSEKNITLCQKNSRLKCIKTNTYSKSGHRIPAALSCQGVPFQTSLSGLRAIS